MCAPNQRIYESAPTPSISSPNVFKDDYFGVRTRQQSIQGSSQSPSDDFSGWSGPGKQEPQTPSTPRGIMGRLKNFEKLTKKSASDALNIWTPESATTVVGTPAPPSVGLI
jgi:WD repeat-containing protein 48